MLKAQVSLSVAMLERTGMVLEVWAGDRFAYSANASLSCPTHEERAQALMQGWSSYGHTGVSPGFACKHEHTPASAAMGLRAGCSDL